MRLFVLSRCQGISRSVAEGVRSRAWLAVSALAFTFLSACAHHPAKDPAKTATKHEAKNAADRKPGGPKRVIVDKTVQKLSAFEGKQLVMESHVSTGGPGHNTPSGSFRAGYKEEIHYSSLYENAPMPWSVQVHGNFFIHGFSSVPDHPASHGCIRMPLDGDNPAKRFYEWVDVGTPITVTGNWKGKPTAEEKPAAKGKSAAKTKAEPVLKPAPVKKIAAEKPAPAPKPAPASKPVTATKPAGVLKPAAVVKPDASTKPSRASKTEQEKSKSVEKKLPVVEKRTGALNPAAAAAR